jgi:LysR family hydrogen peroxide-inducible transcriptional activator
MNIRDLRYLVAVAELRHFGKAAEACFVSQPTLSGQLKKLEGELGVVLFERSARSVVPTPVGERIIAQARRVLDDVSDIESLAQAAQDPLAGPLHIGAIHTISPYVMPEIMAPLRHNHPQMRLILHEDVTDNLTRQLLDHRLDAALLATPVEESELEARPLYEERFCFAHPADHPFARDKTITARHLTGTDLLLLTDGHCLADQVLGLCHASGLPQESGGQMRAASMETLVRLVGKGFGYTLIPALAVREGWLSELGVVARPIDMAGALRRVSLVYRRPFPRVEALDALATLIQEWVGSRLGAGA